MKAFRAGALAQLITLARSPNSLLALATMPLSAVAFLGAVNSVGRVDLVGHALVAPVLMGQWAMAMLVAGELVESERRQGTLELLVAAPAPFAVVLAARITAVTVASVATLGEVWIVATLLFGLDVRLGHPGLGLIAIVATSVAVAGWATVMSAALVLARSPRVLQNTLTFPCYLLGGVLVPVSFLPAPLRVASRGLVLSWSADLLRDAYGAAPVASVWLRLGVIVALGLVGFALGHALIGRALHTLRSTGRLALG
jgi:ABC-2 type transport system permease protein